MLVCWCFLKSERSEAAGTAAAAEVMAIMSAEMSCDPGG